MARKKKPYVEFSYLAEYSIEEGLALIEDILKRAHRPGKFFIHSVLVKRDSQRLRVLKSCKLSCYSCGVKATHFVVLKHRNDKVMPYQLNIMAGNKMLTWDHILPKSLEGSNDPLNARCACKTCNEVRGNEMTLSEMVWVASQDPTRIYAPQQIQTNIPLKRCIAQLKGDTRAFFSSLLNAA